ncbi:MAG TPA: phosphate regulon sensor histidine kinase PhoR [Nevskiaceae bacterium]|nr:phosphate regulon sensor histidine kinase PhoR [Nevskiaceae bacterium]
MSPLSAQEPPNEPIDPAITAAAWRQELFKLGWKLALGYLIGAFFDEPAWGIAGGLSFYVFQQVRYLRRLREWVDNSKRIDLPEVGGLWGSIFEGLIDQQRRHRKRKKRLASIVAQFQASTAALPDGAVVLGPRAEIVWFNKAAQALLGLRAPQDIGLRVANLLRHPNFTRYVDTEEYEGEVEVPSPINRTVTMSLRIIPYGEDQRLMICRDVSERKRLETARREFVANASHELRTPLTVLRGYLDMMIPESQGRGALSQWRAPLKEMRGQAARMENLIADLLRLARLESDAMQNRNEDVNVPGILRQLVEDAMALSKGRHRIEADIEPDTYLYGRESDVQSIFSNLISNAVQYTPEGGTIRVRWWSDREGAHGSVQDTGIGIAPADLPRLTERFYRVDTGRSRASGGTGLGLAIVKHGLEHHEAKLDIDSELGRGSTFTCHFPPSRVHRHLPEVANG